MQASGVREHQEDCQKVRGRKERRNGAGDGQMIVHPLEFIILHLLRFAFIIGSLDAAQMVQLMG
jgi:hypothetical protein